MKRIGFLIYIALLPIIFTGCFRFHRNYNTIDNELKQRIELESSDDILLYKKFLDDKGPLIDTTIYIEYLKYLELKRQNILLLEQNNLLRDIYNTRK